MHRSGTSLITQWLKKCGLHVGQRLLGAGLGNDDGHYEDLDFVSLHEELLKINNLTIDGFIYQGYIHLPNEQEMQLKDLLSKKNTLHTEWGWKDPRTCLFLDYYNCFIPDAYYLIIVRNYLEVVTSLVKREFSVLENKWLEDNRTLWKRLKWHLYKRTKRWKNHLKHRAPHFLRIHIYYNEQILVHLSRVPANRYIVANYRNLISHDVDAFNSLRQWGFQLAYIPFSSVFKPNLLSKPIDIQQYLPNDLIKTAEVLEKRILEHSK